MKDCIRRRLLNWFSISLFVLKLHFLPEQRLCKGGGYSIGSRYPTLLKIATSHLNYSLTRYIICSFSKSTIVFCHVQFDSMRLSPIIATGVLQSTYSFYRPPVLYKSRRTIRSPPANLHLPILLSMLKTKKLFTNFVLCLPKLEEKARKTEKVYILFIN